LIRTETEIFNVLLLVGIALILARVLGYLFSKIKQPAVIGEIIAGLVIGSILFYISDKSLILLNFNLNFSFSAEGLEYKYFNMLAEIGILFLLFISGLQISVSKIKKMGKNSTSVAIGGVFIPLILGIITGLVLNLGITNGIIIGLILTATSVGVTVRTLMDLNVLDTDIGATILGGAVIDDILGIILLTFALGIQGSLINVVWVGAKIGIFFLIFIILLIFKILERILDISEKIHLPKAFLSISLSIILIYSFIANWVELSGIIGAFLSGILIGQCIKSKKIEEDIKTIGYGFFVPIFFVWIGLSIWLNTGTESIPLIETIVLALVIIFIGIIGKIIGCGIGARISGMTTLESIQIGAAMIPRMELALIMMAAIASSGFVSGVFAQQLIISTILLTIVTTIITPFFIKALFKNT